MNKRKRASIPLIYFFWKGSASMSRNIDALLTVSKCYSAYRPVRIMLSYIELFFHTKFFYTKRHSLSENQLQCCDVVTTSANSLLNKPATVRFYTGNILSVEMMLCHYHKATQQLRIELRINCLCVSQSSQMLCFAFKLFCF